MRIRGDADPGVRLDSFMRALFVAVFSDGLLLQSSPFSVSFLSISSTGTRLKASPLKLALARYCSNIRFCSGPKGTTELAIVVPRHPSPSLDRTLRRSGSRTTTRWPSLAHLTVPKCEIQRPGRVERLGGSGNTLRGSSHSY